MHDIVPASVFAVTSRDLFLDIAESAHRVAVLGGRDETVVTDDMVLCAVESTVVIGDSFVLILIASHTLTHVDFTSNRSL